MFRISGVRNLALLAAALWLSGCAATESFVSAPSVNLTSVKLSKVNFKKQTFLLAFDVENPNAFPLPVRKIRYRVMLENSKFASGETQCDFTIPALGDGAFVMSVELDLLQSSAELAAVLRNAARGEIDYELDGSLTVDIPLAPPIDFSNSGRVMVQALRF